MNPLRNIAYRLKKLLSMRLASPAIYMGALLMSPSSGCGPHCPHDEGNRIELLYCKGNDSTIAYPVPYNRMYLVELDSNMLFSPSAIDLDVARQQMTAVFINDTASVQDTVYFRYTSVVNYMNPDCGMQFKVSGMRAESHSIATEVTLTDENLNLWEVRLIK